MRSIEDKGCNLDNNCSTEENANGNGNGNAGSSCMIFDFKKSGGVMSRPSPHHRSSLGKPTPSKWDDAQKWLVNLSRGEKNPAKASPRNSNADDRRLIAPAPKKEWEDEVETKNVECDESMWRGDNKGSPKSVVRSICLRDMGTEMTPIGSKEPSRAATPIRAISPVSVSPSRSSPVIQTTNRDTGPSPAHRIEEPGRPNDSTGHLSQESNGVKVVETGDGRSRALNPLEARAAAWEEAERAKYMARYKREDVRIQAWENHEKKKAEMENRKVEVKAEQVKKRAKEKCNHRIAAIQRLGEEKRAVAEAKLNQNAINNSQTADYIRRNGHLPSSFFSFKIRLPSRCSCSCW